jgi:bifunctional non-homologous end joining protein LigD
MNAATKVPVQVDGRTLTLTNLDKVLYPAAHFTKAQVIDYYTRIAPVLLPHLAGRPLTMKRYPDGVDAPFFFEKNAPRHRPDWIDTVRLPAPGSTKNRDMISYLLIDSLPGLVWVANLGSLELHTPMWRVDAPRHGPDLLVVDLDPGPPATITECCQVALIVRDATEDRWVAKTSGSKGLQLYAAVRDGRSSQETSRQARSLAERLERAHPTLVVSKMTKSLRPGKVLVDWSQNNSAKTTVTVYSLRARPQPTVSTPVTWAEVEGCALGRAELVFTADDVVERVAAGGDLFETA